MALLLGSCAAPVASGPAASDPAASGPAASGPAASSEASAPPALSTGERAEASPRDPSLTESAGAPEGESSTDPVAERVGRQGRSSRLTGRAGDLSHDFVLRLGIGFSSSEQELLRAAVRAWAQATGLPLRLRDGYGPTGLVHIIEEVPTCGQRSFYDGLLGCYNPRTDVIAVNRPGIRQLTGDGPGAAIPANETSSEAQERQAHARSRTRELLYVVFLHELGHWLGLPHAELGDDSIMLADLPRLMARRGSPTLLSAQDVERVCSMNPCAP